MHNILEEIDKKNNKARRLIENIQNLNTEHNMKNLHKAYEYLFDISRIIREYKEENVEKLLKKVDDIVENIDTDYLLKKIEEDKKQEQDYEIYFEDKKG